MNNRVGIGAVQLATCALALCMMAGACSSSSGLSYTRLSLRVAREDGTPAAGFPSKACTTMPVLLGAMVEERRTIESPLVVVLRATRDVVDIDFEGEKAGASSGIALTQTQMGADPILQHNFA